jgi:class 3 adenylate cyclase/tetratricopeptide (TPR) repeat protein
MRSCSNCGAANPSGQRFCGSCGAPLASPARSSLEERKVVTILFCDLVNFTQRASTMDPEDVRAFLVPYYEILTEEIERHGGTLDKFLGDGVMAVFGAPVAHEDDPERAVRTGLRALERLPSLGMDLHARIGINTGEVLLAADSFERGDAITGDAANTASRLQGAAPIDGVVVGQRTYDATANLFRYEALDPVMVKGKAEALAIYRPHAPIASVQAVVGEETTAFVGRELELSMLTQLFERSRTRRSTEFVTIIADPGLGKSRLIREFGRLLAAAPGPLTWRVGRCLPFGDGVGFWALAEIVKSHAGILETDDQATISAKLDAVLTEPDPAQRDWMKDRVAPLVGLETAAMPPQQPEAFTAWRRFLEGIANEGPTVLVIEDLHWADQGFVAFLTHLADSTSDHPLMVVVTARPEIEERHPSWPPGRRSTVLSLAPLDDGDLRSLIAASLVSAEPDLVATILERAGGSPLYAEQLAAMIRDPHRSIGDGALDGSAIPPSIQALLAARLDTLPAELKALLLDASVVGKTFWSGAVALLSGRDAGDVTSAFTELARREFVRAVSPSTMAGEAEFTFWHALVHDVAYTALPRRARMVKHQRIAGWLAARTGGALGGEAEILLAHLTMALDLATELSVADAIPALRAELADALLDAAHQALRTEPPRAIDHLQRTLTLLGSDDPRRSAALAALGRALLALSRYREAVTALEEARALLRETGDEEAAAELAIPLGTALGSMGDRAGDAAVLAEARAVLAPHPGAGLVDLIAAQARGESIGNRLDRALELATESIDLAERLGVPPSYRALIVQGHCRVGMGDRGGEPTVRHGIELAAAAGDLRAAGSAFMNLANALVVTAGPAVALAAYDEAIAFHEAHGMPNDATRASRLAALTLAGRWDDVLSESEAVRDWATAHNDAFSLWMADTHRATVLLARGEPTGPLEHLVTDGRAFGYPASFGAGEASEAALVEGRVDDVRRIIGTALDATPEGGFVLDPYSFVRTSLRIGDHDLAHRVLTRAEPPAANLDGAISLLARATLAEAEGATEAAAEDFDRAASIVADPMFPEMLGHARAGLGRCLLALGKTVDGASELRAARVIFEELRATPRIAEIDEALAST